MTIDNFITCSIQCQAEPLVDIIFILFVLIVGLAGECSIFIYLHHVFQNFKHRFILHRKKEHNE